MTLGRFAHTRDMQVAIDVSRMVELRRFEEEFIAYGCIFFENGERRFLISGKENSVWNFGKSSENYDKYPFVIQKCSKKTTVPAGTEDIILESLKIQLAKELQECYSSEFCAEFFSVANIKPDNQAEPILLEVQEKIAGLYYEDNLIAFEGLLNAACYGKHLTSANYTLFKDWLQRERKEMETEPKVERRLSKTFFGICYYKDGKIKSYCNGEKARVYEKQEALFLQGYFVSNVYEKTYWHNGELSVQTIKETFINDLLDVFDNTFFSYLSKIRELPPAINRAEFIDLKSKYQRSCPEIKKVLNLYQMYWGL